MNDMNVLPGSEQHAKLMIGQLVKHQGERVGTVREVRPNMENGRRYAFIKPCDASMPERRLPLDELQLCS